MRIRKGDLVQIMNGDDAGKTGKIKNVIVSKNKVIVEGMNMVFKHLKPSQDNPKGARIQKEAAIASSKVMPVCKNKSCAKFDKGVRIKMKILNDKQKVRACNKCGSEMALSE